MDTTNGDSGRPTATIVRLSDEDAVTLARFKAEGGYASDAVAISALLERVRAEQVVGRPGTKTDGWEYDYHANLGFEWPNGVKQVQCLVGTVIRAKPHNGSPAGVTASFIAVRQS